MRYSLVILMSLLLLSCKNTETHIVKNGIAMESQAETIEVPTQVSRGAGIINKAIEAHGGGLYKNAHYSFVFRKKKYTFKNDDSNYSYTVETALDNGKKIIDQFENNTFERRVDGQLVVLNKKEIDQHSSSLNSVIYFTTLPFKLSDQAVNKKYIGDAEIKKLDYHVVQVTFNKDGGGKDHEDQYYYWINTRTNTVDYFAYNYIINGGGVRFRSYFNRKNIDGILFQDYINWKAPNKTALASLPTMFENDQLIKASTIENTQINNLKTTK